MKEYLLPCKHKLFRIGRHISKTMTKNLLILSYLPSNTKESATQNTGRGGAGCWQARVEDGREEARWVYAGQDLRRLPVPLV